jgi:hypothetical protein
MRYELKFSWFSQWATMTSRRSAGRKGLKNTCVDHKQPVSLNNTRISRNAALCEFIQLQRKGLYKAFCSTYFNCLRLCEKVVLSLILVFEARNGTNPLSFADYSNKFHERSSVKHKYGVYLTNVTTTLILKTVTCTTVSHLLPVTIAYIHNVFVPPNQLHINWGLNNSDFKPRWRQDIFYSLHTYIPDPETNQPPVQWLPATFFLAVNWPGRGVNYSPQRTVEIKLICSFMYPLCLHGILRGENLYVTRY